MKTLNRNKRNRSGAAVVEFAVCLPLLALLVFGTIEAASRIFLKQTLSVAAYETAREAVRAKPSNSSATALGNDILKSRQVVGGNIKFSPSNFRSAPRGSNITVEVSAPTLDNSPILGRFIADKTITAKVVMVKE